MSTINKLLWCYLVAGYFTLVFTKVGFNVKVTTWNVNEKSPVDDMNKLIDFTGTPDFYAFALQEVNPKANPLSKNDDRWVKAIKGIMNSTKYELIDSKSIDGSLTAVFAKPGLLKADITSVDTASKRTGHIGVIGNKGATAVRFDYKGTSIVFVGAHFHAHDKEVAARVQDYNNINNEATFKGKVKQINDHDVVFWAGDLNFRIDDLTAEEIEKIVASKTPETVFTEFLAKDQLRKAMKEGLIFQGYAEGRPQFNPTYKYKIGENNYNLERKPAYTDRVLYHLKSDLNGRVLSYTANTHFTISDHKPVTAVIAIE